ncbi:LysM peptidoglycan-binding domain-containing protein [Anaerobacillus sp. HL2]|nr:LysM peptidoglycan-binding domain-containing protein [Anaerobacillus sp. HL2]
MRSDLDDQQLVSSGDSLWSIANRYGVFLICYLKSMK